MLLWPGTLHCSLKLKNKKEGGNSVSALRSEMVIVHHRTISREGFVPAFSEENFQLEESSQLLETFSLQWKPFHHAFFTLKTNAFGSWKYMINYIFFKSLEMSVLII